MQEVLNFANRWLHIKNGRVPKRYLLHHIGTLARSRHCVQTSQSWKSNDHDSKKVDFRDVCTQVPSRHQNLPKNLVSGQIASRHPRRECI
jgi:hypothetical protein